ncbi:hypothetical protein [Methanohalobium sp.]|uniref:hypothetical protein n=1 Tax=Methanohalobium sp. TaxID=2837493 RepID=UPI0025CDF391|nr:hypothetical protein [Methanohalobium sp.]
MRKTNYELVKEFHETFGHPVKNEPGLPDVQTMQLRYDLIEEELEEMKDGMSKGDVVSIADAIGDILYVAYGAALCYGVNADDLVQEIHDSNMTKLGEDGKPIRREDGKIMKGPSYRKPDIESVIYNGNEKVY